MGNTRLSIWGSMWEESKGDLSKAKSSGEGRYGASSCKEIRDSKHTLRSDPFRFNVRSS